MATLIILERPDARHIPWFAMGLPWFLEDRAADIDIETGLDQDRIVGRRCADWVRAYRGDNAIRLVATRNFIEPRTALYVTWLLFRDETLATQFLDAFPRYGIDKKIDRLRRERQLLTERLEQRLKRGGFDLSRVREDHRWIIATRYLEAHDKIADTVCDGPRSRMLLLLEWIPGYARKEKAPSLRIFHFISYPLTLFQPDHCTNVF
jgi:hypothetical protein